MQRAAARPTDRFDVVVGGGSGGRVVIIWRGSKIYISQRLRAVGAARQLIGADEPHATPPRATGPAAALR